MRKCALFLFNLLVFCLNETQGFEIVWNVKSSNCLRTYNLSIPVDKYGIRTNNGQEFWGREIVLFYESELGLYPHINKNGERINGGVPQAINMLEHLKQASKDIDAAIPNSGFNGLAIIDWEAWRPVFSANWGKMRIYNKVSRELVLKKYPGISKNALERLARKTFEEGARKLMTETLRLGKQLRPYAKWGFYGFPMCHHQDSLQCSPFLREFNKKLKWLFRESTALYPSIYLKESHHERSVSSRKDYIYTQLRESLQYSNPKIPVYAYSKFIYNSYNANSSFYEKDDLCSSIKQPADLGVDGVILWSSWKSVSNESNCLAAENYIEDMLGPYARETLEENRNCAAKLCHNHGRCKLREEFTRGPCESWSPLSKYECHCKFPFYGPQCKNSTNSSVRH